MPKLKCVPPPGAGRACFIHHVQCRRVNTLTHTCTSRYSKCGFHISKLVADISRFSCKQTRLPALVTQTVTYSMNLHMYTVPTNALLVSTHNCWSLKHFSLLWSKGDEEVDRTKCDTAECNKGLKTNMATYSWTKAV